MFRSVTLEMSLKPFKQTDDAFIREVCARAFEQWHPLIKDREEISVMLWTADGSELLDYTGDPEQEFEWAYFLGTANLPFVEDLPAETSLHRRKQLYMEQPPKMTYGILKRIVSTLKEEGQKRYPKAVIRIGETFDIGPEFAISDFKYHRHREVCHGSGCDKYGFVDATALLKKDGYPYAAFPNGVPDQTPMGTLLGAQANLFLKDMGFDYLWLSNGMGFCYEPWSETGKIYDGKEFHEERLTEVKEKVVLFWKLFRDACPDFPIRTRGTNFSVGMDYASDGVPLYDIYQGDFHITPPPNSPWAAINDDMGIEVLGQLTRNCMLPGEEYMFRYYLHDIWWVNSPWYDRYEGNPHDIYIPMALSRVTKEGKVHTPSLFHILSIDNSMGELPDSCANESIPHFLKAEKDVPDELPPLVLVYPMREYTTATDARMLREMYFGDVFVKTAINRGLPLAGVVSTDYFAKHDAALYEKSVLLVPAAFDNAAAKEKLNQFAGNGGKIIAYGSLDALETVSYSCLKADIAGEVEQLLEAMDVFGWSVCFVKKAEHSLLPTMTLHRSDNAMMFNVYNRDTTVETRFRFPLGAPVINGYDTFLTEGYAAYQFPRSVHGECRVFVKQDSGIVRAREMAPANRKFRRKIRVSGLKDAEVCLFPEQYCAECSIAATLDFYDGTPIDQNWEVVKDPRYGTYLRGKNVNGDIYLCMPFADRMEK